MSRIINSLLVLASVALIATPATGATIITFDEVPSGTDLTGKTIKGVQFTQTGGLGYVAGTSSFGLGFSNGISNPAAFFDGNFGGSLRLDFLSPTHTLAFDYAVAAPDVPISNGGRVALFDPSLASIGDFSIPGNWNANIRLFEAKFSYVGPTPIGRAVLTATSLGDNHQGIIDNIAISPVPEANSLILVVSGLILVIRKWKRGPRLLDEDKRLSRLQG